MHFKEFFIWCIERNNYVKKNTFLLHLFLILCTPMRREKSKTRASAQRCTNTPGWRHYLIFQNNLQLITGQDIRQNHWTTKYRSLTFIYFMRSIFVSYWFISPNMMFVHQISFKILSKITDTKYRSLTYIIIFYEVNLCVTLINYIIYDLHPSNSFQDMRQNQVTDPHLLNEANLCVTLIHYPKYNTPPSNSLQDIKQNHWTMKYRSLTCIYFMRSVFVSH